MEETIATGLADAAFAVQRVVYPIRAYLDLLPANIDLAAAEMAANGEAEPELQLRRLLEPLTSWYDFVVVDCPRNLGLLTANALCASQEVLIPVPCEPVDIRGTRQALQAIERLRRQSTTGPSCHRPRDCATCLQRVSRSSVLSLNRHYLAIQQTIRPALARPGDLDNVEDGSSQGPPTRPILTAQAGGQAPGRRVWPHLEAGRRRRRSDLFPRLPRPRPCRHNSPLTNTVSGSRGCECGPGTDQPHGR
jgi:hypothetical protein